ncbi:Signal transduction histidine kinase [Nannocystis exedens]|uniref:histidine kinase n=1 Tax=Nannocystis exedens TaxID=54 RepID=A0A1I1XGD6_9BACT|nr:HAMP domain-containing sensor histidine kinase [Nannocystis exedens]PCC73424.1 hybrid sensor histidine kinase/response regulator [Nannocystis exedens]SFE06464.1 Signal transduction histidine kinase [Nannocystis exedens]
MSSVDGRPHAEHAGFYRGLFLIAAVAVPTFGLVEWPEAYDSFPVRLLFSGVALAVVAASFRSAALRRRLRLAALLYCYALFAWFCYVGYRHAMTLEDILGLLPVVVGVVVNLRRARELVLFLGYIAAVLALVYRGLDAPAVPFSVPLSMFAVFAGVVGWMSIWRTRLEEALQVANATLEARVAERTALLEREVAERVVAERRANAASEAKSRFLANMSHELRTPLNAVIGYAEIVEEELAASDRAHLCADLDKVGRAARHLLTIIDDVLDLSRIEAGSLELRRERVAVAAALDDALVLVRPRIDARRDRLAVAVAPALAIVGDHDALVRVFAHLLGNAAKFTEGGTITVAATRVGDEIEVLVRDTGIGIPAAALPQIFERFTQADDSSTRLHGGAGLGLALCKELVEMMHGAIAVASVIGEGSSFTVRLPAA